MLGFSIFVRVRIPRPPTSTNPWWPQGHAGRRCVWWTASGFLGTYDAMRLTMQIGTLHACPRCICYCQFACRMKIRPLSLRCSCQHGRVGVVAEDMFVLRLCGWRRELRVVRLGPVRTIYRTALVRRSTRAESSLRRDERPRANPSRSTRPGPLLLPDPVCCNAMCKLCH